jgi:hypothetical protein
MKKIYVLSAFNFNDGASIKAFTPGFMTLKMTLLITGL